MIQHTQHAHRRRRVACSALAIAAVVVAAGCGGQTTREPSGEGTPAGTVAATDATLAEPRPVPDDPDPAVRAGAAGQLVSCDGAVHLGGSSPDFGGPHPAASPREGLDAFLELHEFGLPTSGYREAVHSGRRVLFSHDADDHSKVAIIVADTSTVEDLEGDDGWIVETFAACDPAEYDPSVDDELLHPVWTDVDGNRVPTTTITSLQGAEHCDWQTATFLYLDDRQYVRDPNGLLRWSTVSSFDPDAQLPTDAIDTGYRRGDHQLWLSGDGTVAYVVTDGSVEAWPATRHLVACM